MIEKSIRDFAYRMDMPAFALNQDGLATLNVGDIGQFHFENTKEELILYISLAMESYDNEAAQRLLELNHYNHNHPFNLSAGLYNDTALLLVRLAHKEVTAAAIENAFHFLLNLIPKAQGK